MSQILWIPGLTAVGLIILLRLEYAVLIFFAINLSIQHLASMQMGPLSGLECAAILIPLTFIIKLLVNHNIIYELNKDLTILLFYVLLFLLFASGIMPSTEFVTSLMVRIQNWAKFASGFVIFLVTSSVFKDEKKVRKAFLAIPLTILLPGIIFYGQLFTGDLVRVGQRFMPSVYFQNEHTITYVIVIILPIVFFNLAMVSRLALKGLWLIIIASLLIIVFYSYARTGWIAVAVELIFIALLSDKRKTMVIILLCVAPAVAYFFADIFASQLQDIATFFMNLSEVFKTDKYDYLFSSRWFIFRRNLLGLWNSGPLNFLFGFGIGGSAYLTTGAGYGGGHSSYIVLLSEFGIINFSLYFWLIGLLLVRSYRLISSTNSVIRNLGKACLTVIVGYLTLGLGTHFFYFLSSGVWLFWGICGIMIGVYSVEGKKQKSANEALLI